MICSECGTKLDNEYEEGLLFAHADYNPLILFEEYNRGIMLIFCKNCALSLAAKSNAFFNLTKERQPNLVVEI